MKSERGKGKRIGKARHIDDGSTPKVSRCAKRNLDTAENSFFAPFLVFRGYFMTETKVKYLGENRQTWKTPKKLYARFMGDGYFDPCPSNPSFDGLNIEWESKNFVNPPYAKNKEWTKKALEEAKKGKIVVMLLPARTSSIYFKELCDFGAHLIFFRGRLHFDDGFMSAPFSSMLVCLNIGKAGTFEIWGNDGI